MSRTTWFVLLYLGVMAAISSASADVLDASPEGFTTRHEVTIPASRLEVYEKLTRDVGQWWNAEHTVSGDAASLYIDPRPMGCFCETLGPDAGLVHMMVTFANPGVLLRLSGGLGPLGLMGVSGNMTFEMDEVDGVTTVALQYAVGGYQPGGLDQLAAAVDGVLVEQLERLANYVESGSADGG